MAGLLLKDVEALDRAPKAVGAHAAARKRHSRHHSDARTWRAGVFLPRGCGCRRSGCVIPGQGAGLGSCFAKIHSRSRLLRRPPSPDPLGAASGVHQMKLARVLESRRAWCMGITALARPVFGHGRSPRCNSTRRATGRGGVYRVSGRAAGGPAQRLLSTNGATRAWRRSSFSRAFNAGQNAPAETGGRPPGRMKAKAVPTLVCRRRARRSPLESRSRSALGASMCEFRGVEPRPRES